MSDIQSGPCEICGATNYGLSYGGPTICPSCDCGDFGLAKVQRQAKEIEALRWAERQATEAAIAEAERADALAQRIAACPLANCGCRETDVA